MFLICYKEVGKFYAIIAYASNWLPQKKSSLIVSLPVMGSDRRRKEIE
jgi:hypothetical protein